MKDKNVKLLLKGLDCANCANKIEEKVNKLQERFNALGGKHNEPNGNNANVQSVKK